MSLEIRVMLLILIIALSFPIGYLLAGLARDELVSGRRWFLTLMIISFLGAIISILAREYGIAETCASIFIAVSVSYRKSFDKGWVKRRFK